MLVEICVLAFIAYFISTIINKDKRLPPGPFQWPIIGNLPQLAMSPSKFPHITFENLAKVYGDVMSLKIGSHNAVMLSSYEAITELLGKEEFSGRYDGFAFSKDRAFHKILGLIFLSGEPQKNLRRFVVRSLRDVGFGKSNSMSNVLSDEFQEFNSIIVSKLKARDDGCLTIEPDLFSLSFVNILWAFVAGYRFSHSDDHLKGILKLNDEVLKAIDPNSITVPFPALRYIAPERTGHNRQMKVNKDLQDYMRKCIHEIQTNYEARGDDKPASFIEAFIQEIKNSKGESNSIFTEEQLIVVLMDLFLAGSETNSNMLTFAIMYMTLHPDVQRKVQDEISIIATPGQDTLTFSDLTRMPYTEATINEIYRLANVVPLASPRKTMSDYIYKDYLIPKGTCVMFNTGCVAMDKKLWGDPENFRPERFLDATKTTVVNKELILPFGFGKRVCLGETLARDSFFILFTALLKKYNFQVPDGASSPSVEAIPCLTLRPAAADVLVTKR